MALYNKAGDVSIGSVIEGDCLIEKAIGKGYDAAPSGFAVLAARQRAVFIADDVRPVESIIQRAPPRIRRVDGVAGIVDGNHQLRPRDRSDLRVYSLGRHTEIRPFRCEITYVVKKCPIGFRVMRGAAALGVPLVDQRLKFLATRQQGTVFWR